MMLVTAGGLTVDAAENVAQQSFRLDLSADWGRSGGLIAYDVNGDGGCDLIFSQPGVVVAYEQDGNKLWKRTSTNQQLGGQSESNGLPGLHGPGIQAGDIDGDGTAEVLYVTKDNTLAVVDGPSGEVENSIDLPEVDSHYDRWEHVIVGSFRRDDARDVLLQASVDLLKGGGTYLRDSIIAAYGFDALEEDEHEAEPLWRRNDFVSVSHGVGKVVDLNRDGKDEVVGGMVISSDGELLVRSGVPNESSPHIDSVAIGDVDPDVPGLEVAIPEESGQKRVILFTGNKVLWSRPQEGFTDGDKVQIGNFDPDRKGLEIFLRGANANDMRVYGRKGDRITDYEFDEVKEPESWTDGGIEDIFRIRWTGEKKDLVAVKERHEDGDAGIMDPMTAHFTEVFNHAADRIYVADLCGDWREELVVVEGDEATIYQNQAPNPRPDHPSLWNNPTYRRLKMTWNYYSP